MEGVDYTALLNAVIGLVTAAVIWISVRIGRKTEADKNENPARTGIGIAVEGAAIISSEPLMMLARSIEAANVLAVETNAIAKERTTALRSMARATTKFVDSTDKLTGEIEELRNEMARRR